MKLFRKLPQVLCMLLVLSSPLFAGYFEQGSRYFVYKKYDKAREMFLKAVEKSNDGNAYYFLGEIEKNEKNYDKAQEYYESAVKGRIQGKYLKLAYWNIIILAERKSDFEAMVRGCRELWERLRDPGAKSKVESIINKLLWTNNEDAKENYKKGIRLKNAKDSEQAIAAFRAALQADYGFLAPKFEIGLLELKNENDTAALGYFNEVAEKIPFYGEVHLLLGDIHFRRGSYRESRWHFEKALDLGFLDNSTRAMIYLKNTTSGYNMRDYAKAKEDALRVLSFNSGSLEALLLLSAIYIKEEKYEDALTTLKKAGGVDPANEEIVFQIGSIYYKKKNPAYITQFERLYGLTRSREGDVPLKYNKAFSLLAKACYERHEYARAEKILTELPESLKDSESRMMIAKSLYHQGKLEQSLEHFEKLYLRDDEDRLLLGRLYARTGRTGKAKELLLRYYTNDTYWKKVKSDTVLKKIADMIEADKKKEKELQNLEKPVTSEPRKQTP